MHLDDNERDALAKIEASLSGSDPDFSSFLRRSQRFLPPRFPTWSAIGVSGVLLVASAAVLATSLRLGEPLLLIPMGALLVLAIVPVTVSVRRSTREPTHRPPRRPAAAAGADRPREAAARRHTVVVATDGKPESDAALRFSAAEAALRCAEFVVVITYWRPVDPDLDDIETPESELQARAHQRADAALRRALSLSAHQLPAHRIVSQHGDVSRRLLREFGDAEMLVVGTHRRRLLQRIMRGHSTSGELVRQAHVPVVVVPPTWT